MKTGLVRTAALGLVLSAWPAAHAQQRRPPAPSPAEQEAVQRGLDALFKALGEQAPPTPPAALADHRELKALLPAEIQGMKRVRAASEKSGAADMAVSRAEARYEDGRQGAIEIEIADLGGLGGVTGISPAAWASVEIDRETDTGFARTTQYRGFKAMEQYDRERRRGQMQVFVGGRFLVTAKGHEVSFETLRAALDPLDLKKLATLAPPASTP